METEYDTRTALCVKPLDGIAGMTQTTSLTSRRQPFSSIAITFGPFPSRTPIAATGADVVSSRRSTSARQRARQQGLARTSALTLGISAASVLGAFAIAVTLPESTAANATTSVSALRATPSTSTDAGADSYRSHLHTTVPVESTGGGPRIITLGRP